MQATNFRRIFQLACAGLISHPFPDSLVSTSHLGLAGRKWLPVMCGVPAREARQLPSELGQAPPAGRGRARDPAADQAARTAAAGFLAGRAHAGILAAPKRGESCLNVRKMIAMQSGSGSTHTGVAPVEFTDSAVTSSGANP